MATKAPGLSLWNRFFKWHLILIELVMFIYLYIYIYIYIYIFICVYAYTTCQMAVRIWLKIGRYDIQISEVT